MSLKHSAILLTCLASIPHAATSTTSQNPTLLHHFLDEETTLLPFPTPLPYMLDQAAHEISTQDAYGFSVSRLASYGVRQVGGYSIDCATFLSSIPPPGSPQGTPGQWYDEKGLQMVDNTQKQVQEAINIAHGAGLQAYLASDIFQFPVKLLEAYSANLTLPNRQCIGYDKWKGGCIYLTNTTREFYSLLFDELITTAAPGIDGIITRYGENSPCDEHQGNAPYDTTDTATMISSLTELLLFFREELCVKRNLTVIFRTWDTSTSLFHANATFYQLVTDPVPAHPKLVFSIKHTMLDFWRRVRVNPTLGVGHHAQIVEAEVGGMYQGCGTRPLYVADGIINTYEEYAGTSWNYGLNALRTTISPTTFAGVLTNHQCTSTPTAPDPWLWWRLEQAVLSNWARTPGVPEAELFDTQVQVQLGITDPAVRAVFRNFTLTANSANLRLETCEVFDVNLEQVDRPTANWLLWDGVGGLETLANTSCHAYNVSHCEVVPWLYHTSNILTALAEKQQACDMYDALNETAHQVLAPGIPNSTLANTLLASVESGTAFAHIIEGGWTVMLWGYAGDQQQPAPVYNVSGIREGIARYDAAWEAYRGVSMKYGNVAPGLVNDTYWQHPNSNVSGMRQSVDMYRGV